MIPFRYLLVLMVAAPIVTGAGAYGLARASTVVQLSFGAAVAVVLIAAAVWVRVDERRRWRIPPEWIEKYRP